MEGFNFFREIMDVLEVNAAYDPYGNAMRKYKNI